MSHEPPPTELTETAEAPAPCAPLGPNAPAAPTGREPTWADFRAAVRAGLARQLAREAEASRALVAEVVPKVARAVSEARAHGLCQRVWLFGSFAWGEPGERSDVDLLVEGASEPFRLASLVSVACDRDAHVIELDHAPESLRERAQRDGRLL